MIAQLKSSPDATVTTKKKDKRIFALHDVMVTSRQSVIFNVAKLSGTGELHSNAARYLEVLTPKQFVQKNKKKKKLSTLKKKILLERLRKHVARNLLERGDAGVPQSASDSTAHCFVHLRNFVSAEDIEDEDEKAEVVSNIMEILAPFSGSIFSLEIRQETSSGDCYVAITFKSESVAQSAVSAIDGLVFSGSRIEAVLLNGSPLWCLAPPLGQSASLTTENQQSIADGSSSAISNPPQLGTRVLLCLSNMLSAEDVADEEEVAEVLSDVHALCSGAGQDSAGRSSPGIVRLWIEKRPPSTIIRTDSSKCEYDSMKAGHAADGNSDSESGVCSQLPWGLIEYISIKDAVAAIGRLNGLVVGGSAVSACLYEYGAYARDSFTDGHLLLSSCDQCAYAVRLAGFVEEAQVVDSSAENGESEEKGEIMNDVRTIVIEGSQLTQRSVGGDNGVHAVLFSPSNCDSSTTSAERTMDVFVVMHSLWETATVATALSQRVVSGTALLTEVVALRPDVAVCDGQVVRSVDSSSDRRNNTDTTGSDQTALPLHYTVLHRSGWHGAVVAVRGFFSPDDIATTATSGSGPEEQREELFAMKRDLLCLARGATEEEEKEGGDSSPGRRFVSRVAIHTGSLNGSPSAAATAQPDSDDIVACVGYHDTTSAEAALLYLDGFVIGGRAVRAHLEPFESACAPPGSEPAEDGSGSNVVLAARSVVHSSVAAPASGDMPVTVGTDTGTRRDGAEYTCVYYEQFASTDSKLSEPSAADSSVLPATDESSGDVSKYVAAKAAPKLTMGCAQSVTSYRVADEETDGAVKELLRLVSTFQARAKEKNPLKAKQKLRFVTGIKQATTVVKVGKVRLLLLAPNVEESDELDSRIGELLQLASDRGVPVLYCLSKRLLGKALQMSMKQSVVAVLDPDGAYELFKKILLFIRSTTDSNIS